MYKFASSQSFWVHSYLVIIVVGLSIGLIALEIANLTCAALSEHCRILKKVNLSSTRVTFLGMMQVLNNSPLMKSVDLRLCHAIKKEEKEQLLGYPLLHVKVT